jgi:superfamily II DNA or RNA helicase
MYLFDAVDSQASAALVMPMRNYQQAAHDAIIEAWQEARRVLAVMPTGTGKTILFAHLIRSRLAAGRALVLAHRQELIFQAAQKIEAVTGVRPVIEMGDLTADCRERPRIIVSTVQTQATGRMHSYDPMGFATVIIDEAHHATAGTYRKILEHYSQSDSLRILGVTATPDRSDEIALGKVFDAVAYDYELTDAIGDGWLVPIRQRSIYVEGFDLVSAKAPCGDFTEGELERAIQSDGVLIAMAKTLYQVAAGQKTIAFMPTVASAEQFTEMLLAERADCARLVTGKTPDTERRILFRDYAAGSFQYLVNVGVATEGFDEPSIECVALCRPTKSRALYAQMVGRGTRPLPGVVDGLCDGIARRSAIELSAKPALHVVDFVGNAGRHKLVSVADILGGRYEDEVVELARAKVKKSKGAIDVGDALRESAEEIHARRKAARERKVKLYQSIEIDPRISEKWIDPFDSFDIEPERERGWFKNKPITDKMAAMLKRNRINPDTLNYTQAKQVIGHILRNPEQVPCTPGQARVLKRFGYQPGKFDKAGASRLIDAIANNGWKRINHEV